MIIIKIAYNSHLKKIFPESFKLGFMFFWYILNPGRPKGSLIKPFEARQSVANQDKINK